MLQGSSLTQRQVSGTTALAAKVDALTQRLDQFILGSSSNSKAVMSCETCGAGHATTQCPILVASLVPVESVDYVNGGPRGPSNACSIPITRGGETIQISLGTKASHNTDHHHLKAPRFNLSGNRKGNIPLKTFWQSS